MKVIYIILLSTITVLFVVSQIATYTDFFCFLHCDRITVKLVSLSTTFILIGFIIGNANYGLILNKANKIKKGQLKIGIYLAIMMIAKIIISYTFSLHNLEFWDNLTLPNEIKTENSFQSATHMYMMHGKIIQYYDLNKTKRIYEPSQESVKIYKLRENLVNELGRTPFYITAIFTILILSYYLSTLFAKRKIQWREDN